MVLRHCVRNCRKMTLMRSICFQLFAFKQCATIQCYMIPVLEHYQYLSYSKGWSLQEAFAVLYISPGSLALKCTFCQYQVALGTGMRLIVSRSALQRMSYQLTPGLCDDRSHSLWLQAPGLPIPATCSVADAVSTDILVDGSLTQEV